MLSFDVCECGAPLQRMEKETPAPKGAEVVLKVLAAGVCHSDLHIWDGYYDVGGGQKLMLKDRGIKLPLTMGHENVGEVIAVGPDVQNLKNGVKVGDVRLIHPWMGCGECVVCRRGEENLCVKPCSVGIHRSGGFATHVMVPHPRYLFDITGIAPERAAPLACSGVTAFSALKKVSDTLTEEPVVMIGAGGVGLMALALHRKMGGKAAIVVDIDPAKREAALKAGASHVIDGAAKDVVDQVRAATGGGAWAVIDFVGAGPTVKLGVDATIKGGKVVVVGLFGGDVTIPTPFFPMKALTVQGSYVGSLNEIAELIDLVKRTGAPDVPVKTRPLGEVNAALNDLRDGKIIGRVVITPQV
jgi:D-arabinose 1-dehydrogenase-like Zn-dependent alcohol dehydrogenase